MRRAAVIASPRRTGRAGRTSSTALMTASEDDARGGRIGDAGDEAFEHGKHAARPRRCPCRLPRPPMITAMKQNGRMSTPVRNSTVVIGAAMAPPSSAMRGAEREGEWRRPRATGMPSAVAVSRIVPHGADPGAELGAIEEEEEGGKAERRERARRTMR